MKDAPIYVMMALADMERYTALIHFETAVANREMAQLDGWRSDHAAGVAELEREYLNARVIVEQYCKSL